MAQSKLRVVDKDPSVKLARQRLGVLMRLFPEAKLICLVRDVA